MNEKPEQVIETVEKYTADVYPSPHPTVLLGNGGLYNLVTGSPVLNVGDVVVLERTAAKSNVAKDLPDPIPEHPLLVRNWRLEALMYLWKVVTDEEG